MIPDLISTLIAIVLVCTAVLDQPLLDSQHGLLLVARHSARGAGSHRESGRLSEMAGRHRRRRRRRDS